MARDLKTFLTAFNALPNGNFEAIYQGRRYGVTKTLREGERQAWFWAEERGGTDKTHQLSTTYLLTQLLPNNRIQRLGRTHDHRS